MAVHTLIHELPSRIAEKIEPDPNDCWLWTAYRNRAGYGLTRQRPFRTRLAHRIVWLLLRGSIPDGLHLDHLCRVRACVNPNHLRVVTCAENNLAEGAMGQGALNAQKARCPHGHPYDEENTFVAGAHGGQRYRQCKTCMKAYKRRSHVMASARLRQRLYMQKKREQCA